MLTNVVTRTQPFGRGGVILKARGDEPLALDAIASAAPTVFQERAHESRSNRFAHIPTGQLLRAMEKEGFSPFEVRVGGSRDEEKRAYTKHMIRFRHATTATTAHAGGLHPEVILINAHDGTSSYQLLSGLFRTVCTNGLIAGEMYDSLKIGHTGDVLGRVIEGSYQIVSEAPRLLESAREMSAVVLSAEERELFARSAAIIRFSPKEGREPPVTAELLRSRRADDQSRDLWTTLNVVQENAINGGQHYHTTDANNRRRRGSTRPVNGVDANRDVNRALWTLAEGMRRLKAAA